MAEIKTDEQAANFKLAILEEIKKVKVQHPRAADFEAKMTRGDDCFAILYNAEADACRTCAVRVMYEGKEMPMHECCKIFMSMPLVEQPISNEGVAEAEPAATPGEPGAEGAEGTTTTERKPRAPRAASTGGGQRREELLELIKAGINTQPGMVKKLGCQNATVNQVLRKMMSERLITREKDPAGGRGFIYAIK